MLRLRSASQGTKARLNSPMPASAQPTPSSALLEYGPSRRTRCKMGFASAERCPCKSAKPSARLALSLRASNSSLRVCIVPTRSRVPNRFRQPASAHQCHAQIELRVGSPVGRAFPAAQRRNGVVVAPLAHHELREQHVAFRVDARVDLVRRPGAGPVRILPNSRAGTKPCQDKTRRGCARTRRCSS